MPATTYAQRRLLQASYKGVSFEVTDATYTVGRRVAVFEFPQKNVPFVEDLGRKATTFAFTAFVIGDDYIERMNALVSAIESDGSGKLVHPWLGEKTVIAKDASNIKYSSKLRQATIDLNFVEAPKQKSSFATDSATAVRSSADSFLSSAVGLFCSSFHLQGAQDFVQAAVSGNLAKALKLPVITEISQMFELSDTVSDLASDALAVVQGGSEHLAERIVNALGLGQYATTVANWRRVSRQLSRLTQSDDLNKKTEVKALQGTSQQQIETSTDTINTLIRQVEVANIIGAAANVGTALDSVTGDNVASTMSYDELISVRDEILEAIDDEMLRVYDDDVYTALQDARTNVWECVTERANDNARIVTITQNEVMPAIVLAYDYYGDANRDSEIIGRNGISNPNFLPASELKLLSR